MINGNENETENEKQITKYDINRREVVFTLYYILMVYILIYIHL